MKKTMLSQKKELIYSAISMSCILGLIVFCLVLLPNFSFSWFSKNKNVEGSGMSVDVEKYPLKVEYARYNAETMVTEEFSEIDRNSPLNFLESDIWYPGYSVIFKLKITNVGKSALCVNSVGFCAPTEDEERPLEVEEQSYYLGTQLCAAVIAVNETTQASPEEKYLLTLTNDQPDYVDLKIYEDTEQTVELQPSQSMQLTVRLTFVNKDVSQDVYRNFGKGEDATECCQRRLFLTYIPIE